ASVRGKEDEGLSRNRRDHSSRGNPMQGGSMPRTSQRFRAFTSTCLVMVAAFLLPLASFASAAPPQKASSAKGGQLRSAKGDIQHVIYIIFDNVHFLRDNPNVPSDLEQMPNLLNFIRGNGTLMTKNHTVLISHTANGILTSLTGLYSDGHGQPVANS